MSAVDDPTAFELHDPATRDVRDEKAWRDLLGLDGDEAAVAPATADPKQSLNPQQRDRTLALATRAAGHDVTPGHDQLHHYWTRGEGLAKWRTSPHPWATLRDHLLKYVNPHQAVLMASKWFEEVFGYTAGSDLHRIDSGKPPRGKVVGPG
jgi:hypothetical protein